MSFNKTKYSKKINKMCSVLSKNKTMVKKCKDITLKCHFNKCLPYITDTENADITEDEVKECNKKSGNNFKKQIKCVQKTLKKKGFLEANAKKGHCVSKNCPELYDFMNERFKELKDKISLSTNDECVKKHCQKELDAKDKVSSIMEITNKCNIESDDYKKQKKCYNKNFKKNKTVYSKLFNCKKTHCEKKL